MSFNPGLVLVNLRLLVYSCGKVLLLDHSWALGDPPPAVNSRKWLLSRSALPTRGIFFLVPKSLSSLSLPTSESKTSSSPCSEPCFFLYIRGFRSVRCALEYRGGCLLLRFRFGLPNDLSMNPLKSQKSS